MELYFGKPSHENLIELSQDEYTHLVRVRRAQEGETVMITDGEGHLYKCILNKIFKDHADLSVTEKTFHPRNPFTLHLAIGPTKNTDRIEWFTEKATEIGIEKISFINCRFSERKEIKTDRIKKIAISAMKQSGKFYLPEINEIVPFKKFVELQTEDKKVICTMNAEKPFGAIIEHTSALVLIGPEGDFHPDEIKAAYDAGFVSASLGKSRLRTETAALSVCVTFSNINRS